MNLIFIPNLIKGNSTTRKYVFLEWIILNYNFLNPLSKYKFVNTHKHKLKRLSVTNFLLNSNNNENILLKIKIVYINLAHRNDRKRQIIREFNNMGIFFAERFDAIKNNNGALGCAYSHLKVLELWNPEENEYLLVFEDDIVFDFELNEFLKLIQMFVADNNLDILCLGFNNYNEFSYNDYFKLTTNTQTASCYLVKSHMKTPLVENYKKSIYLLENNIDDEYAAIDQVWKKLQSDFNFVIPTKRVVFQRESYSDIESKVVDYGV